MGQKFKDGGEFTGNVTATGSVSPGNGTTTGGAIWSGSGAPSNTLGADGDFYTRTDTPGTTGQQIYMKSAGAWVAAGGGSVPSLNVWVPSKGSMWNLASNAAPAMTLGAITDLTNNEIRQLTAVSETAVTIGASLGNFSATNPFLASRIAADGTVYLAIALDTEAKVYTYAAGALTLVQTINPPFVALGGIAFSGDASVLFCHDSSTAHVIAGYKVSDGTASGYSVSDATRFTTARGMSVTPDGRTILAATDYGLLAGTAEQSNAYQYLDNRVQYYDVVAHPWMGYVATNNVTVVGQNGWELNSQWSVGIAGGTTYKLGVMPDGKLGLAVTSAAGTVVPFHAVTTAGYQITTPTIGSGSVVSSIFDVTFC